MAVKERVGTAVSAKLEKTVVVAVESRFPHPTYQKTVSRTPRYKAHDEANSCRAGARVSITETRPMSRHKRWAIAEVLSHSPKADKSAGSTAPAPEAAAKEVSE